MAILRLAPVTSTTRPSSARRRLLIRSSFTYQALRDDASATLCGIGCESSPVRDPLLAHLGGARDHAIKQEGFGAGKADREEQRDAFGRRWRHLAGADRSERHEPLLVGGPDEDVGRVVGGDLLGGVGGEQGGGFGEIGAELCPTFAAWARAW